MKLVFIVSGEPLTITSHVSVVKNFLATDEIAGRDVIIWIIYIGIMIHRFRVEWSIGLDLYTTRCKGEARVGFSWRVKHRFAYTQARVLLYAGDDCRRDGTRAELGRLV